MNILFITNHLNIGGITSYVFTLASGLKSKGHKVYIASSTGELLQRFIDEGIVYFPIPIKTKQEIGLSVFRSFLRLRGFIKEQEIEIIHSHSRTTQVLGCLLDRFYGIAHISTCHGFFKRRFFRRAFPCWGRKVIAISEAVKEHLTEDFAVDEKNIALIHNGIDLKRFLGKRIEARGRIRADLAVKDNEPIIGIIARLSDVKGHIYLIRAMPLVSNKAPKAKLLIIGDGKMKAELVNLAKVMGVGDDVFFMPQVSDTKEVLSAMDLFVLPSLKEGLGLALMEAMASGLPVVASNIGGIRTLIKDGYNGLLAEPADVEGLAKAILELLQNPDRAESLGAMAMGFISDNFSQEKMVLETQKIYLECLNTKD